MLAQSSSRFGTTAEQIVAMAQGSFPNLERPVSGESHVTDDLGLDSLAVMDFVMAVEDRFDVAVPMDRLAEVRTLSDLARLVDELKSR